MMLIIDLIKLQEYADLEGSSIGEYLRSVIGVANFDTPHGMSEEFKEALYKELQGWLNRFENETTIESHSIPQPNRIYKELIWNDE